MSSPKLRLSDESRDTFLELENEASFTSWSISNPVLYSPVESLSRTSDD